ncbi:endonuclease/exonuclease/phosphatase family protein [Bacteroidota bacterium]
MKKILRRLIGYTNLFFAILLVLSSISPNISPESFWGPSFIGLAFPYILLFNIIFILFWIFRKKREFIISFLAILLSWNTLVNYVGLHPAVFFRKAHYENLSREKRHSERLLKITSFNVRAFDRYRWADNPSARQEIIDMFREDDPDILCLQEFYSTESGKFRSDELYSELDRTPYHHIEYTISNPRNKYGIATFSFYPIIGSGRVELNNSLSICSFSDIKVFDDTLRVYNMHLQSIRLDKQHYNLIDSLRFRYDDQQMEEIRDISSRLRDAFIKRATQADLIAEHIEGCPFSVIVCGDFNDTPVSYSYRRISGDMGDVFAKCGWGTGRTYNGNLPSFRIDYILFGQDFEAKHFARKKVKLSDHFPITGYLKLREREVLGEKIRGWIIAD